MAQMRLDKLLSSTGRWSRREVKQLVREGRVLADGRPAVAADDKYDPEHTVLQVDGERLSFSEHCYVMLHKPTGVLSATEDRCTPTVLDLLPLELQKRELFPVGRLDKDTEGLLLLTDDGPLAHRLLSPRRHVDKVYYARLDGVLTEADCAAFADGLVLEDGYRCLPAQLRLLADDGGRSEVLITLHEGKFHQVKRMAARCGAPVLYLKRLSMGPLRLDPALECGKWRYLTKEEKESLLLL
ncbi:rRNA pseudouridine synthase [bacterium 210917-DFI.7.65]|nr:rRNA pseudouridine synthase [Clostridiales bacterium]MCB6898629.1 rRNA pseudouridine synthase [bacterium 210917-DFI.7.65]